MLNVKIRTKLLVLCVVFATGFAAFGVFSTRTLERVKVTGPNYEAIISGKDLVADILPPPAYIIEAFLTAQLMHDAPAQALDGFVETMARLERDYEARHAHWRKTLEPGALRREMLEASYEPAVAFFSAVKGAFIPALKQADSAAARAALDRLTELYAQHRRAIDNVVAMANDKLTKEEVETAAEVESRQRALWTMGGLVLTLAILLSWATYVSVVRPLRETVDVFNDIADGDGDLTRRLKADGKDEVSELARAFNLFAGKIHDLVGDSRRVAEQLKRAAEKVSASADRISGGAQDQASSLEETAASLEEITSTVRLNADNARQAADFAGRSRGVAEQGGHVVESAVSAMSQISRSSKKIAEIITTIDEIAFQTNVLALNAAVEAARAGEQGRGFAVVATEVGNLSQRSAEAAKEIKSLIQDAVAQVDDGAKLVNRSGETLKEIVASVARVTEIINDIAAASGEQSSGVEQVSAAVNQIDSVTQTNASATTELAATSRALSMQAAELLRKVNRFRLSEDRVPPAKGSDWGDEDGDARELWRQHRNTMKARAHVPHNDVTERPRRLAATGTDAMDRIMEQAQNDMDGYEEV